MENRITPFLTPSSYDDGIMVAVRIVEDDCTWNRELVGFSQDEVTKKEVKFNLSIDLLNAIADANWLNHYYEEHDTYITDMESRLGIESFAGWKADSFELENAKISFDGLKWRLSNEEGQEIILDDWSKDKPFFRWIRNPLQPFSV
jgi:hypothetical protein|tara:strand:- start:71 stop:508 length:438 start_codon:yes stop_codon:yes gene_type:complete